MDEAGPSQFIFWAYFRSANFAQTLRMRRHTLAPPGPTAPGNGGTAPENGAKHDYPTFEPAIRVLYTRVYILVCGEASSLPTVISQCVEVDKA